MGAEVSRRYLGIIPARGGSKRLPGKNLQPLRGKPLLAYTIEAASASRRLTAVVVSTDSEAIARCARACGADPQGLRPKELARDDSPVSGALIDALRKYERNHPLVDAIVLLQPTSPFRSGKHIDEAIAAFEARKADTVTSVRRVKDHPYWIWTRSEGALRPYHSLRRMTAQRNELPEVYIENGAVLVIKRSLVVGGKLYGKRVVPLVMDELTSIDIDTPLDFAWAEFVVSRRPHSRNRAR
ncbi:MAG TPA: acylneuraminate cytidylyltransferase family protein [Burkholderiales bacterium]|nr:acylneuraminate cytidylyltransferase family protein [Burkholderiales bacterium]